MTEVIMPKMGDAMEEGTLLEWKKKEGEEVQHGEVIGMIQTDKAVVELTSPGSGKLSGLLISEGQTVPVGEPIAAILSENESLPEIGGGYRKKKPTNLENETEKRQKKPRRQNSKAKRKNRKKKKRLPKRKNASKKNRQKKKQKSPSQLRKKKNQVEFLQARWREDSLPKRASHWKASKEQDRAGEL